MTCLTDVLTGPWWTTADKALARGQLIWGFVPHVDQVPVTLVAEGRAEPTLHDRIVVKLQPLRVSSWTKLPPLPVAALPAYENEVHTVYRAKRRPALVVSMGGHAVDEALRRGGGSKWQSSPTVLVAPYYGADPSDKRAGWSAAFIDRIRRAEYPQYLFDSLPLSGVTKHSILRLDHLQPLGRHHESIEVTPHRLSEEAMKLVDEQVTWLMTNMIDADGAFYASRQLLTEL